MSDRQTERIRGLLDQAAATDPDLGPADRATAVARRGRSARRRTRLLGAGAVAAVLVGAIAVPRLVGDDTDSGRVADEVPSTPPAEPAEPCPDRSIDVTDAAPVPALGDDVVSVRRCPAVWDGGEGQGAEAGGGPAEALTGDYAAAFAEDVAALPTYELPPLCASIMAMPDPWALVVGRPEGDPIVIGSTVTICGAVNVGGVDRSAEGVQAAFAGNLERQQAGRPTPAEAGAVCPTGDSFQGVDTWNSSFDVMAATSGAICYRVDPMGSREYVELEGGLSPDQLATIRADLGAHVTTGPRTDAGCIDTGPQRLLVLVDDEGDRAALLDAACTGEFSGLGRYWQADEESEAVIADALGGAVPQP